MSEVEIQCDGGLARVILNRPDKLNAMNGPLMDQLAAALEGLADDGSVRCVMLAGAGRSFSAGGDLAESGTRREALRESDALGSIIGDQAATLERRAHSVYLLHTMRKPTLAVIHGHAVGGALALALACDLRLAASSAKLRLAYPNIGLSGDFGITWLLDALVGSARARELCLLDPVLSAEQALGMGLITRLVDDAQLDQEGEGLGRKLADGPTFAFGKLKENLYRAKRADLGDFLRFESLNTRLTSLSHDAAEASASFHDKRPPKFEGR